MEPSAILYEGKIFQRESGEGTEPATESDGKQVLKICRKVATAFQTQDQSKNEATKHIRQKGSQGKNPA